MIVAVSSFLNVRELRRLAHLRRSAIVLATLAGVSVVGLGVLEGLIVTAAISLGIVVKRISRPRVTMKDGVVTPHTLLVLRQRPRHPRGRAGAARPVMLDLQHSSDLDVETVDMLADLDASADQRPPTRGGDAQPARL